MAIDTPARIAIIGAGPIGLEAALYARFLGYEVDIFERGAVADNVCRWGHVQLFSPWSMNATSLGRAAIDAQILDWDRPNDDEMPTGLEFAERYLLPLASCDLVADGLHEHTEVIKVGRDNLLKGDLVQDAHRGDTLFRLLVRDREGHEHIHNADIVIDATGTYGNHNAIGVGGIPALGEQACESHIEYELPDIENADRKRFADRHTLVIGTGYSAATSIVALGRLAESHPKTRATWLSRSDREGAPIARISDDRLAARDALADAANRLAADRDVPIDFLTSTHVEQLTHVANADQFDIQLGGTHAGKIEVDRVIASVGYRPNLEIFSELQVHTCYATDGPMKLAAALLGGAGADCLSQVAAGPATLLNPEPNFYILGAKSFGRSSNFLMAAGHRQIRDLFAIIGDRADLDLYKEPEEKLGS